MSSSTTVTKKATPAHPNNGKTPRTLCLPVNGCTPTCSERKIMRRCLALAALMFFVFPSAALAIQRTDCLYLEPQPAALEAYWSLEGGTQGVTGFRIRHRSAGTTEWSNYVEVPITSAIHFHYTLTGLAPEATEVLVTPRLGETAGWSEKATAMIGSLSPST